ncbi:hypothetical protein K144312032_14230 [Clostridium tetani]|uniref:BppU family phage baseplate upper protein n=1 Tax=Clostridium tetani TaxID=1513 RepID=UPI002955C52F|nr:BppU family phage baseplate upper protein [Clostridium tetani]BDR67195.1 hypothetical protein K144312032_14230 [Clostridium tetani]
MNKQFDLLIDTKRTCFNAIRGLKEGDNNSVLNITLVQNSLPFDLTDLTIRINYKRPDNKLFLQMADVTKATEGKIKVNILTKVLNLAGEVKADLSVFDKDNRKITSVTFRMFVDASVYKNDYIEPEDMDLIQSVYTEEEKRIKQEKERVEEENIRIKNEENREEQESIRENQEEQRQKNEKIRSENEKSRKTNEELRDKNEQTRNTAEEKRNATETERKEQEDIRSKEELNRKKEENTRIKNEKNRQESEDLRIKAETERIEQENIRQAEEEKRITAELERVENENKRIKDEKGREEFEGVRRLNEELRIRQESERNKEDGQRTHREEDRIRAENIRIKNEESRQHGYANMQNTIDGFSVCEEYNSTKEYKKYNRVTYNGSSYECLKDCVDILPINTEYWICIAKKGRDGTGVGDMLKSIYDKNDNGVVDLAEKALSVEWDSIENAPNLEEIGKVKSVNGKDGEVVLKASDIKTSSGETVESQLVDIYYSKSGTVNIYTDENIGNDKNNGLSVDTPVKTLLKAISILPVISNSNYQINLQSDIHVNDTIYIYNKQLGGRRLEINGGSGKRMISNNGSVLMFLGLSDVMLSNITIDGIRLFFSQFSYGNVSLCKFINSKNPLTVNLGSVCQLQGTNFENIKGTCIETSHGAFAHVGNCKGGSNDYGLWAARGSIISKENSEITGERANEVTNFGGVII